MLPAIRSRSHSRAVRRQHEPSEDPELPGDPAPSLAIPALGAAEASTGSLPPPHLAQRPRTGALPHSVHRGLPGLCCGAKSRCQHTELGPGTAGPSSPQNKQEIDQALHAKQCLSPPQTLENALPGGDAGVMLQKQEEEEDSHWHWPRHTCQTMQTVPRAEEN